MRFPKTPSAQAPSRRWPPLLSAGRNNGKTSFVTISGGTVTATGGNNAAGIQGRDNSVFSTGQDGSALIIASSISDKFSRDGWSGIIFEGNAGQLYGNPTLNADAAIPSGKTLTYNGTIGVYGTISDSLTNHGTIMLAQGAVLRPAAAAL